MNTHCTGKARTTKVLLACLAVAATFASSESRAGVNTHISGVICKPANVFFKDYINYTGSSAENRDTSQSQTVYCGLPMYKSIGQTLEFDINVVDNSSTANISCTVVTLDSSNNPVYTASASSTGTGQKLLHVQSGASAGNDTPAFRYYATCTLPAATGQTGSQILSLRLF
jgi:hypothetical protein